jgi:hypothetical protein
MHGIGQRKTMSNVVLKALNYECTNDAIYFTEEKSCLKLKSLD